MANEESNKKKKVEKREDKIFNNRYNQGDGLRDPDGYGYSSGIQVESTYSNNYLNDIYDYENSVDYQIFLDHVFEIIKSNIELNDLINEKDGTRNKFNKEEINFIFDKVTSMLEKDTEYETFSSSIYVLEAISSITAMEYKKIFDFLDYNHREVLLSELNKKYKFLDWKMNKNNRLF